MAVVMRRVALLTALTALVAIVVAFCGAVDGQGVVIDGAGDQLPA